MPFDPEIPLLRIYPKEPKTLIQKNLSSIIYNHQDIQKAQVPISRWVDTTMGHLHNGILLDHIKGENFTLCDSMDGSGEHYAKWNKPGSERQVPYDVAINRN